MIENYETSKKAILEQIALAKKKNKSSVKVMIYQLETTKQGKIKKMFLRSGFSEGCEGCEELKKMGYSLSYEKFDKQVTERIVKNVPLLSVKKMNTTNLIIKW